MQNNPESGSGKMELFFFAYNFLVAKPGNLTKPTYYYFDAG